MSSEPSISARGLGKKFTLHSRPWHRLAVMAFGVDGGREHWALRGVDLDLGPGDCVGIVGRNGAGKSTLLELICGIRTPSEGTVERRGRIAALLQLGAGFNLEFTGRENVFLAAALYGLTTDEIKHRFADIEDFADIGEAIDRPVREYSSGMYARLAFSVCAHVDADILVVDEILGVGDVRFQQKSMRFLRNFRKRGIVLFVSHNEQAVAALCSRALWIDAGRVAASGSTKDVLNRYRREMSRLARPSGSFSTSAGDLSERLDSSVHQSKGERETGLDAAAFDPDDVVEPDGAAQIVHVGLIADNGAATSAFGGGEWLRLSLVCKAIRGPIRPRAFFALRNATGQVVFAGDTRLARLAGTAILSAGEYADIEFRFRLPYLPTGNYAIDVFLLSDSAGGVICHDWKDVAAAVRVLSRHISGGHANVQMDRTLLLVGAEVS